MGERRGAGSFVAEMSFEHVKLSVGESVEGVQQLFGYISLRRQAKEEVRTEVISMHIQSKSG